MPSVSCNALTQRSCFQINSVSKLTAPESLEQSQKKKQRSIGCTRKVSTTRKSCCRHFSFPTAFPTAQRFGEWIVCQTLKLVMPRSGQESRRHCAFSVCATTFMFPSCRLRFGGGTT